MSDTNQLLLFGPDSPAIYPFTSIYDPDINGADPESSGKTVPHVDSIVVYDQLPGVAIALGVVKSVHPVTRKATIVPGRFISETDTASDRIIGYGNDIFMLFYDERTTPKRLVIDSKLIIFGNNSAEYRLMKADNEGVESAISLYINSENQVESERVPIEETGVTAVRRCANCYTTSTLTVGDRVTLELYDAAGILTARITLIAEPATILNDLSSAANPIVDFTALANQQEGAESTDPWFLYSDQNPSNLTIFPKLHFANGATQVISVDNQSCFIYGLGDVNTQLIGREYPILLKYFLADRVQSPIAQGDAARFITYENVIKINARTQYGYSKISVVPTWNSGTSRWQLRFFAYYQSRNSFLDITSQVTYDGTAFSGTTLGTRQNLVLNAPQVLVGGGTGTYVQTLSILLDTVNSSMPYTIASTAESVLIYGVTDVSHTRPRIWYDAAIGKYFVPTSAFANVDKFIENFYINADAPWLSASETEPPTPTHFILRDAAGGAPLMVNPIAIAQYNAQLTLTTVGGTNQYLNSTVLVEFLLHTGGQYQVLYGVPVSVIAGTYNT